MAEQKKFENKPGMGALFPLKEKKSEKSPDATGNFKGLDGKDYQIAGWKKDGKNGKFFSLKIQEKDEFKGGNGQSQEKEDDLPF